MQQDSVPLVDSHVHLWRPDMLPVKDAWHSPLAAASMERLLTTLDDHGVIFAVVAAASVFGTYNDYMRQAMKLHRRLRATAIVDPSIGIHELELMKADGFVGIRLVWAHLAQIPDIDSDLYRRLLMRVADLDWHVHFIEREARTPHLITALERLGIRKIVVDHFGHFERPEPTSGEGFRAVLAALDRGRTWVKLSGGFRFDPPTLAHRYAQELVKSNGGERLLWGSDWPFLAAEDKVTYAQTLALLKEWVPDEHIRRRIGTETPLRLYFS